MTDRFDRDLITVSMAKVNNVLYTHYEDGSQVHQTSAFEIIERMIRMLNPHPNEHVLEIGTGSGYSTALLSNIVGERGAVTSVDIDVNMVERVGRILQQDGCTNVRVLLGDGRLGQPDGAPYNRIIAWASVEHGVPLPLVSQLTSNGVIVCPLQTRDNCYIASFRKNEASRLEEIERILGGFIPMTDTPLRPWLDEG